MMTANEMEVYLYLKRNGPKTMDELVDALDIAERDIWYGLIHLVEEDMIVSIGGGELILSKMNRMQFGTTEKETNFIEENVDVLRKVHQLAVMRNKVYREYREEHEEDGDLDIDFDEMMNLREQSELLRFLYEQDMLTIRIIQTVMYLGSDYMPETEDEAYERMEKRSEDPENAELYAPPEFESEDPEKLLLDTLIAFDGVSEWKDKSIEIDQIDQKMPLDKYMERAFIILGISK